MANKFFFRFEPKRDEFCCSEVLEAKIRRNFRRDCLVLFRDCRFLQLQVFLQNLRSQCLGSVVNSPGLHPCDPSSYPEKRTKQSTKGDVKNVVISVTMNKQMIYRSMNKNLKSNLKPNVRYNFKTIKSVVKKCLRRHP